MLVVAGRTGGTVPEGSAISASWMRSEAEGVEHDFPTSGAPGPLRSAPVLAPSGMVGTVSAESWSLPDEIYPDLVNEPFRILCVCIGNVCRSPVAERLLAARLGEGFAVSSAGVGAVVGSGVHPHSAAALETLAGYAAGSRLGSSGRRCSARRTWCSPPPSTSAARCWRRSRRCCVGPSPGPSWGCWPRSGLDRLDHRRGLALRRGLDGLDQRRGLDRLDRRRGLVRRSSWRGRGAIVPCWRVVTSTPPTRSVAPPRRMPRPRGRSTRRSRRSAEALTGGGVSAYR